MANTTSAAFADPAMFVYILVLSLITYHIVSSGRAYWRLRHFDGPVLAAWSDVWWVWAAVGGKAHLRLSEVCTRYGAVARIGPNTLVTCDEELFKKINNPRAGYRRTDWYKAFKFGAEKDNIISETDNDARVHLRNRVAPGYSARDDPGFEKTIDSVILSLVNSWKDRYVSEDTVTKKPMDLALQVQYLTLDIITALSFGKSFGWIATDSDMYEYVGTMNANFPVMNFMTAVPVFSRILRVPWIQRILSPSVKDRAGMGKIQAVSSDIITQRFEELKTERAQGHGKRRQETDMISSFILHDLSHGEVAAASLMAILAGSDTVATTARSGLVFILTQPRILRTLQQECDQANVPKDQVISRARALELPYLQACCKESLRFHPATTGLLPRVVPPQGDYHDGLFIPGGTIITQCSWNLQRLNFAAYGSDADFFRPERWIDAAREANAGKPERLTRMENTIDLIFSYGGSKCLGQRIALHELPKILFELVHRFEFGFVDGMTTMQKNINYGLFHQEGLWVQVHERKI